MTDRLPSTEELAAKFSAAFPEAPAPIFVRAPGRVNLIGEHLDYNALPVLPMTINRAICVAFASRTDSRIRLRSAEGKYPNAEFENAKTMPPSAPGAWENYAKAAVQGVNAHLGVTRFPGMDALVAGDIPPAAGLSSSSALVVACALAYLRAMGNGFTKAFDRMQLAKLLASAERYTGTRGGGMDQAVILMGGARAACKIDFLPLKTENIPLPRDHVFILCNSLVKAEKTGNALARYNAGPLQCRLIRALAERRLQEEIDPELELETLGDLWYGPLCMTHDEVKTLFAECFPAPQTTLTEAAKRLGMTSYRMRAEVLCGLEEPSGGFPLQARARHLLTEYQRVEAARDALLADDAEALGALMNASHRSCAEDYAVSCPELDALVKAGRDAGACGARLTGAGFGGCTVNLVPAEKEAWFIKDVSAKYYGPSGPPPAAILPVHASDPADELLRN